MLIFCPECAHKVSDRASFCPSCGFPVSEMLKEFALEGADTPGPATTAHPAPQGTEKKRTRGKGRRTRLPNGSGTIKRRSGNRSRPYAAYPPAKYDERGKYVYQKAIGYYADYYEALDALRSFMKNPASLAPSELKFSEVFSMWYENHYGEKAVKKLSVSAKNAAMTGYGNLAVLHDRRLSDLRKPDLQAVVDSCTLGYSSLTHMVGVLHGVYKYALENDFIEKDYSKFVRINKANDNEKGEPFSPEELSLLWENSDDPVVQTILMMCYSGFRISALETLEINLAEGYFKGGVKTRAGKGRTVPISPLILPFAERFDPGAFRGTKFRPNEFYPALSELGIATTVSGKKHTPHDCRHTFSWLCDHFGVDDLSKHLLMGHSLGGDVERAVYGHRTLDELRAEIAKLAKP